MNIVGSLHKVSDEKLRVKAGRISWPCVAGGHSNFLLKRGPEWAKRRKNIAARDSAWFAGQRPVRKEAYRLT